MCNWSFQLAQTCNRILGQSFRQRLLKQHLRQKDIFADIEASLNFVIEYGGDALKGKAVAQLAEAFRKCHAYDNSVQPSALGSPDDLIELAIQLSPDDPYVLEKCGMYFLDRGKETRDERLILKAVELFEKHTGPQHSVVLHQMGLAHRILASNEHHRNRNGQAHLRDAKICFEQACLLTDRKSCLYLTELALTCTFLDQHEEAEEHFAEAHRLFDHAGGVDDNDAAFLYQNWARERSRRQRNIEHDVLPLFREAIRLTIGCQKKDFYRGTFKFYSISLHLATAGYLRSMQDNALKLEHHVAKYIWKAYDNHDNPIVAVLGNVRCDGADKARSVVSKSCTGENGETGPMSSAAFLCLTALAKSGRLSTNNVEDRRLAVEVTKKVYDETIGSRCSGQAEVINYAARFVFRWLVGDTVIGNMGFSNKCSTDNEEEVYADEEEYVDVCFMELADTGKNTRDVDDRSSNVVKLLQKHLGLHVARVDSSSMPLHDVVNVVAHSKSLLIVDNGRQAANFGQLYSEIFSQLPPTAVIVVINVGAEAVAEEGCMSTQLASVHDSDRWPRLKVDVGSRMSVDVAYSLLNAMATRSQDDRRPPSSGLRECDKIHSTDSSKRVGVD